MNNHPPSHPIHPSPPPSPLPTAPPTSLTPHPRWRFWLPLAFQAVLILAIPVQALYTQATGTSVVLQTAPVDPYNLFRGYYVTLGYDISNVSNLEKLPGWSDVAAPRRPSGGQPAPNATENTPSPSSIFRQAEPLYVILQAPQATTKPPTPWQPVAVSRDRPTNLPPNQIALRGIQRGGQVTYGLERYYIPEEQRLSINNQIAELQSQSSPAPFVVEVKVGAGGTAIPMGFWLKDKVYRF